MQEYLMIGTVLKPQGIRGESKVKPYASRVELFYDWGTLYLEGRDGYTPVSSRVTRIHDGFVYTVLSDCASAGDAEAFRGKNLYIDRKHAAPAEEGSDYIADLIGCVAEDENGQIIGTLSDVLQYGSVDTWVFTTPEGKLMVPALLSVFPRVDPESGRIYVVSERLREVSVLDH